MVNKCSIYNVGPQRHPRMRPETHICMLVSKEWKSWHAGQQRGTTWSHRTCIMHRIRTARQTVAHACGLHRATPTMQAEAPRREEAMKWQLNKEVFLVARNLVPNVATAQLQIPWTELEPQHKVLIADSSDIALPLKSWLVRQWFAGSSPTIACIILLLNQVNILRG